MQLECSIKKGNNMQKPSFYYDKTPYSKKYKKLKSIEDEFIPIETEGRNPLLDFSRARYKNKRSSIKRFYSGDETMSYAKHKGVDIPKGKEEMFKKYIQMRRSKQRGGKGMSAFESFQKVRDM
jgi:hypothetical protein